jgi:hypothetical protein
MRLRLPNRLSEGERETERVAHGENTARLHFKEADLVGAVDEIDEHVLAIKKFDIIIGELLSTGSGNRVLSENGADFRNFVRNDIERIHLDMVVDDFINVNNKANVLSFMFSVIYL